MPKPFEVSVGPFLKGMNTLLSPHLVPPDEAQYASNIDVSAGTLRAIYKAAPVSALAAAAYRSLHYMADGTWKGTTGFDAYVDAPDASGNRVTYYTDVSGGYQVRQMLSNGKAYKLGLAAPAGSPAVSGGSGGACFYAITFYDPDTGQESNPQFVAGSAAGPTGAALSAIPTYSTTGDTNRTNVQRRIYRTEAGASTFFYYVGAIANNTTTTYTDSGSSLNKQAPLNWASGGNLSNTVYPLDHAEAPLLTCLADSFYLPGGVQGSGGLGILFGATNNVLRWSSKDSPGYWPSVNQYRVNAPGINAIVISGPQAFLFCENDVFAVTGSDETSLTIARTNAPYGVKYVHQNTVARTPYGIVFLSREGLALFDGSNVQILSRGLLDQATLKSYDAFGWASGQYVDGYYYLHFGNTTDGSAGLRFDLRDLSSVKMIVVESFSACTLTSYPDQAGALYVVNETGAVKRIRPSDGGASGAEKAVWGWISGAIKAGNSLHQVRPGRFILDATGTVSVQFTKDSDSSPFWTTSASGRFPIVSATHLYVTIQSSDGTGEVRGFRITGDVTDGT
jgi:hypothetical protein